MAYEIALNGELVFGFRQTQHVFHTIVNTNTCTTSSQVKIY